MVKMIAVVGAVGALLAGLMAFDARNEAEELRNQNVELAKQARDLNKKIAESKQIHDANLAKQALDLNKKIAESKQIHDAQLAKQARDLNKKIAESKQIHDVELAKQTRDLNRKIAESKQIHDVELAKQALDLNKKIAESKQIHDADLAKQALDLNKIITEAERTQSARKTFYNIMVKKDSVNRDITRHEVAVACIKLQQAIASNDEAAGGAARIEMKRPLAQTYNIYMEVDRCVENKVCQKAWITEFKDEEYCQSITGPPPVGGENYRTTLDYCIDVRLKGQVTPLHLKRARDHVRNVIEYCNG